MRSPPRPAPSRALAVALIALGICPAVARAGSSSTGEEYLSVVEAVEPNILFLVDLSASVDSICPVGPDADGTTSTDTCLQDILDAIDQVAQHFDWARYGVAGTALTETDNDFTPIVPLGASSAELSAALDAVTATSEDTRNLGEALAALADDYFSATREDDEDDDDGDGLEADFNRAPIQYHCQENHIIVITTERPEDDDQVTPPWAPTITPDCICDHEEIVASPDEECMYDNVVAELYDEDFRNDLDGTQNIVVHTIAIGLSTESVGEYLFGNAADQTDGEGVYHIANDADEIIFSILLILQDIRAGFYSRSTPVLSADGGYLIYSFYEIDGSNPLGEGHVRAYTMGTDPADPDTYGDVVLLSGSPYDDYGGAYWDAGDLLVSRPVVEGEENPELMEGWGTRDIFTFVDEMVPTAIGPAALADRRMGFDSRFADALVGETAKLDLFLATDTTVAPPCADDTTYDLDGDCIVDADDMQALIDFSRGLPTATFKYLGEERGYWKLGDAPHSTPAVVAPDNGAFTVDPTYRNFLETQRDDPDVPSMVYAAANDGMLHAFFLEDNTATSSTEEGEESWAWIPSYLVYREHTAEWAGRLVDQMLYGRTFLFDGSPVVEDVWIDEDGDGERDCPDKVNSVSDLAGACEWHRVIVVQQGKGGPVTLALDVTDPLDPKFLWEQVDERDPAPQGYEVGRPVVAKVYDARDEDAPIHRWVALWGSGRAVPYSTSTDYYDATEANLYMWAIGDDYFFGTSAEWNTGQALLNATGASTWDYSDGYRLDEDGSDGHPEYATFGSTLDSDGDGNYEYGYIAASLTVVDVDSDGDADTLYFPVTTTYGSSDDGWAPGTNHPDAGDTWMWKALIDTTAPDEIAWCPTAFFDPRTVTPDQRRPEVYYAATASWMSDGSLGLYWGTGTPYDRDSGDVGYLFAVKDPTPSSCSEGEPIVCNGVDGYLSLDAGEGLTADPLVYAGVVYFTTYVPNEDRCELGEGRLYGIRYDDCSQGLDTTGDGTADSSDELYTEVGTYPSKPVVTDQGTILVGGIDDGSGAGVTKIDVATDPFMGTASVTWMEIY